MIFTLTIRVHSIVKITVNGREQEVPDGLSIASLLEQLQLRRPSVAVEVNQELVPREQHEQCSLSPGDRLEIVTLVGGG